MTRSPTSGSWGAGAARPVKFFSIGLFRQKAHDGSMSSGTGVFTQLVLETCAPEAVVAIDPATAQIDYARKLMRKHCRFPTGILRS
jgi:hypothetical protein